MILNALRKTLEFLRVTQSRKSASGFNQYRLNPYNPFTYVFLVPIYVISIVALAIEEGLFRERPFRWK